MYYFFDKASGSIGCEPNSVDECLKMIIDCGFDCDTKDPEKLIAELVNYAVEARKCLKDGMLYPNLAAEAWYLEKAKRRQSEYISKI